MDRKPFSKDELIVKGEYSSFAPGVHGLPKLNTPVTLRENYQMFLRGETPYWMPSNSDYMIFLPTIIPDNQARGMVYEVNKVDPSQFGGKDMFGVDWEFVPQVGGSMVRQGNPLVKDIEHWEDYVVFPDLDCWDWAGCAERNRELLNDGRAVSICVLSGLFERLISFVEMTEALVSLLDEDKQEGVHRLFDRLCVFYDDLFSRFKKWFNNDLLWFHDDWGSQRASLFSLNTCREMIVPYLKRIVASAHKHGMYFELHSCGKNDMLVPAMIEAGVDMWNGQLMNDKHALCLKYGDKLSFGIEPEVLEPTASDEVAWEAAKRFVDEYADRHVYLVMMRAHPRYYEYIYELSRKHYCGEE